MHLILFFNGWGMDDKILSNVKHSKEYEIIILNYPYTLTQDLSKYEKISVVAWSFGVSYAAEFLEKNKNLNCYSVAINGHTDILGKYGISEKIYSLTYNTLSEENFKKFYLNMGAPLELLPDNINIVNLKEQLEVFSKRESFSHIKFNKSFIGRLDKIIPFSKQQKFYGNNDNTIILDCPHYPFATLNTWREIISETA